MSKRQFLLLGLLLLITILFASGNIASGDDQYKDYVPHTPTGCPYGDSIPLDDPKCVPPAIQEPQPVSETPIVDTPVKANSCGL